MANAGRKRVKAGLGGVKVNREGEEEGEEDHDVVKRVSQIVREWTAQHQEGKVIIYGGTIKRVQGIAKALACPAYWRGAGDGEAKAQMVEKWMSSRGGESGWIAATNALGLGVDDPNVRLVVHGGMPRQLVNFVQESGRGGRDRQKSESVVVIRRSWLEQQQQEPQEEQKSWAWDKDTVEYVGGSRCRREVLDREMDGCIDRFGCEEEEEEMCDVCQESVGRGAMAGSIAGDIEESRGEESGGAGAAAGAEVGTEAEAEAAVDDDYNRSRRLIRQIDMERRLQVMQEAEEVGIFEDILAEWVGRCV
ncbi:putative ATP-dependent dna helicase q1, partial [Fusarium flagelliforme]